MLIRDRGWLPHFDAMGGTYFLTSRLADSLPPDRLAQWQAELLRAEREVTRSGRALRPDEQQALRHRLLRRIETCLDQGHGARWLAQPEVAHLVRDALLHFDGTRYDLLAWVVMPNHFHAVLRLLAEHRAGGVVHS